MSAVIDNTRFAATSNIEGLMPPMSLVDVASEIPHPFQFSNEELRLHILIPDFHFDINLPIVEIVFIEEQNVCEVKMLIVDGVNLIIRLSGEINEYEGKILVREIGQFIIENKLTARALPSFVALTFIAMVSLASEVLLKLPETTSRLHASAESPLKEISWMLQSRQITYRIMAIEKALEIELPMSSIRIRGEDVVNISYSYHSIIERSFNWEHIPTLYPLSATQDVLSGFPKMQEISPLEFPPIQVVEQIFEKDINLGYQKAIIENAVIENYEQAKKELEMQDGHIVNILVRSLNGIIKIESIDTPRLPENPWNEQIQKLIDLDSQLDDEVVRRFNELVASTLDGLTEEQKIAITARPELDETAFLSED